MNENSSASEQQRVFFKIGAFAYMRHEGYTEEKIAEKLEFGSVEAMRITVEELGAARVDGGRPRTRRRRTEGTQGAGGRGEARRAAACGERDAAVRERPPATARRSRSAALTTGAAAGRAIRRRAEVRQVGGNLKRGSRFCARGARGRVCGGLARVLRGAWPRPETRNRLPAGHTRYAAEGSLAHAAGAAGYHDLPARAARGDAEGPGRGFTPRPRKRGHGATGGHRQPTQKRVEEARNRGARRERAHGSQGGSLVRARARPRSFAIASEP